MLPGPKLEPSKHVRSARRVICVDDNEFVLEILHWYLESLGYAVTRCLGGESAIEALERELPDVVTLDFEMPKMDGGQVARAMKERVPQIPIVMFSGTANVPQHTLDLVDRFVSKDAANAFATLADAINSVLAQIKKRPVVIRSSQKRQRAA
jgi:CheY-like chemotaxis protein